MNIDELLDRERGENGMCIRDRVSKIEKDAWAAMEKDELSWTVTTIVNRIAEIEEKIELLEEQLED